MTTLRHLCECMPKQSNHSEDIPLGTVLRRICECPRLVLEKLGQEGKLTASHPRFGPFYCKDESAVSGKKEAWNKILEKSVDRNKNLEDKKIILEAEKKTLESYLSAMRRIEKDARDAYGDKALLGLMKSDFRLMMIEDGCFFLQLALLILGVSSKQLGYPDNHPIFGEGQFKKNIKTWIESMFFVGNQIPLVVLNELMKQTFFQNILENVKSWNEQLEVSRMILYELLVLPAIEYGNLTSPVPRKGFGGRGYRLADKQPTDLLDALHCLMLGSRGNLRRVPVQDETEEDDLESGRNTESKDITFSATELEKKGIRFGKLEKMGCTDIEFKDRIIYACLYLPTFAVDDDTEAVWKSLKYYEMSQQQGKGKCEVRSYLHFMNDLICTYEDVKILAKKGIIKANNPCCKEKLPIMLSKLAGNDERTTQNLRLVRMQLRDYSLAPWERFKIVAIVAFILTAVQAAFAVLAYFRPPHQK